MAALDLAAAAGVLKDYYLPAVRNQINQKVMLLEQVERGSEHVEGEEWVLSLHVSRNPGVGARLEGGTLPTAGRQGYKKARGDVKENTGRFEVTGKSIKAMASDKGSYIRSVDSQSKGLTNDVRRNVNRQLFGTSNGVIATCGTTTTSATVVLDSDTPRSALRQLEIDALVDIGTVANPVSIASARTITAVDFDAKTVTISGATVSTTSAAFIFVAGSGGDDAGLGQAEVTGLQSIVSDTGTLFDVSPTTYPRWKATVLDNSGTPRAVTEELFEEALDEIEVASGEEADLIVSSYEVYREYGDSMKTLKRFPSTIDLKGGHKALDVSSGGRSVGFTRDRDCPDDKAFVVNTDHLKSPEMSDWEWMDEDGAILSRVDDKHNYEATLYKFHEFITDQRNAHALVSDLAV